MHVPQRHRFGQLPHLEDRVPVAIPTGLGRQVQRAAVGHQGGTGPGAQPSLGIGEEAIQVVAVTTPFVETGQDTAPEAGHPQVDEARPQEGADRSLDRGAHPHPRDGTSSAVRAPGS